MLQDIKQHIDLVDGSIAWAKEFGKESFPYDVFKEYRRKLKRIYAALEENCSAAAYGESQVGKSYLMSSLLSSPNSPFVITNAGKSYSFIDDINPSGGNNAKIESTGVITRFTLSQGCSTMSDFVKVRNLSVVDIILLLADSYYNDIKINQDSVLRYDDINKALEDMNGLWASKIVVQNEIDEDDVKDITDYIHDVIGNAAAGVNQSNFCKIVAPVIQYVSYDECFPYHTKHKMAFDLPSDKYVDDFIYRAMEEEKVIVLMRSRREWFARIKGLENYSNLILLNSCQNVSLSPGNMTKSDWEKLVKTLK